MNISHVSVHLYKHIHHFIPAVYTGRQAGAVVGIFLGNLDAVDIDSDFAQSLCQGIMEALGDIEVEITEVGGIDGEDMLEGVGRAMAEYVDGAVECAVGHHTYGHGHRHPIARRGALGYGHSLGKATRGAAECKVAGKVGDFCHGDCEPERCFRRLQRH